MILSWKHKGLRAFYETGSTKGICASHAKRLRRVLYILENARYWDQLEIPGWHFHRLTGDLSGFWAVRISGNWRVIFRIIGKDVELVNYLDYH